MTIAKPTFVGSAFLSALIIPLLWAAPAKAQDKDLAVESSDTGATPLAPPRRTATAISQSVLARPATPIEQGVWARAIIENYPSAAIREGLEGRVAVRVTVAANGRVAHCAVSRSSGHKVLDQAACQGMTRSARFSPARDDLGNPTTGNWSTSIIYAIN